MPAGAEYPRARKRASVLSEQTNGAAFGELGALFKTRSLALETTEVVELGAADAARADDVDMVDDGGVDGEDALNAGTEAHFANGDVFAHAGVLLGDENAFECLGTFFFAFADADVNLDGVTDAESGVIGALVCVVDLG